MHSTHLASPSLTHAPSRNELKISHANNVDESEGCWRTGAPHHKQWGVGMKRGSALSHAIPNAKNKMRRKEHELLWVTTDELPWPCLGHAKVSGVTQSNVAPLARVGIPVWHWVVPIALARPSSILHHDDWGDKKWLELGIIFLWDHF
jgi:hypothetical protein